MLDFDTWESYREFPMRARFLARWLDLPLNLFRIRRRKTARGWHVVVYLSAEVRHQWCAEPSSIVVAQLILGSDWRREIFNFIRVIHLADAPESWRHLFRWNTLYKRKFGAFDDGVRGSAPLATSTTPESLTTDRGQTDGN